MTQRSLKPGTSNFHSRGYFWKKIIYSCTTVTTSLLVVLVAVWPFVGRHTLKLHDAVRVCFLPKQIKITQNGFCDDTRAGSKAKNKILEKHYSNFSLWETKLPPKKCACLKENFPSELCRCFGGSCWRVLVKKNTSTKIKSSCMTGTNVCKDITPRMGSPQEQICKAPVR